MESCDGTVHKVSHWTLPVEEGCTYGGREFLESHRDALRPVGALGGLWREEGHRTTGLSAPGLVCLWLLG